MASIEKKMLGFKNGYFIGGVYEVGTFRDRASSYLILVL